MTKRSGDMSELLAAAWLLKHGYEVFRNVSAAGPVDIVALDPETGETVLVDVKTRSFDPRNPQYADSYGGLTERQRELGIWLLVVDQETGDCFWSDRPAGFGGLTRTGYLRHTGRYPGRP